MLNVKDLEDKWKRYRRKKRKPYIMSLIILIMLLVSYKYYEKNIDNHISIMDIYTNLTKNNSVDRPKDNKIINRVLLDNPILTLQKNSSEEEPEDVQEYVDNDKREDTLVDIPILDNTGYSSIKNSTKRRVKKNLDIIQTSSNASAFKDVERRFLKSQNINDALFLARSYYRNKKYSKSEYWALQTNKIDENNKESLFIFVKSKVKLGRINEGMSILNSFIKETNSNEAKKILYRIKNGTL